MPIETFHVSESTHNKLQAGNKSLCTEGGGGGGGGGDYDSHKCVQISLVNGLVPP